MKTITEVIKTVETLTAGRFYDAKQKSTIIRLIAKAFLLTDRETEDLSAFCLNPDYDYLDSLTATRNGLVFLSGRRDTEKENALICARKAFFEEFEKMPLWEDRESWIRYVRGGSGFGRAYERAIFQYATGKEVDAFATFKKYAEECHALSLRFCLAEAREKGNVEEETKYLTVLKKVYEELLYLDFPQRESERLKECRMQGNEETYRTTYEKEVRYFTGERAIGFGG